MAPHECIWFSRCLMPGQPYPRGEDRLMRSAEVGYPASTTAFLSASSIPNKPLSTTASRVTRGR